MPIERLVGLYVKDEAGYARYRENMMPLLEAEGGSFGVDLEVSRVLKAPGDAPMNRVFTIRFPSEAHLERFFGSDAYRAVRAEHFEPAVPHTTILGLYTVDP